jgi:hypothetical protein
MSNVVLSIFGLRLEEDKNVSEDMVRMVVAEAQRTEGIEKNEGRMIEAVLNMDTREVEKIMQPRVDIVALPFGNRLKNSFLRRFFLLLFYFLVFRIQKMHLETIFSKPPFRLSTVAYQCIRKTLITS